MSLVWASVIFWTAALASSGTLDAGGHIILISLIEIVQFNRDRVLGSLVDAAAERPLQGLIGDFAPDLLAGFNIESVVNAGPDPRL
jgi:hypothetical protein